MLSAWMHQSVVGSLFPKCVRTEIVLVWHERHGLSMRKLIITSICHLVALFVANKLLDILLFCCLTAVTSICPTEPLAWSLLWTLANACSFYLFIYFLPLPPVVGAVLSIKGWLSEIYFPDSSSISERRPVEKKPEPVPEKKQRVSTSALKRNPSIKKEMRPDLEEAVIKKLENLGVKPVSSHF